eukprot:11963-Chlamydomonas_euryale.AAC.5
MPRSPARTHARMLHAQSLGLQDVLFTIRVLPFSTISAVWPRTAADFATLNFQALTSPLYRDFTRGIIASRTDSIQLSGPLKLLTDESRGFALSMPKFLPSPNINETWGLDQPLPVAYAPPGACVGPNKERVDCVIGNVTNPYFDPDACGDVCKPRMVDGVQHVYWGTLTVTVRATVLLELLDTVSAFDYKYCLMRIEDFGTRNSNTSDGFTIGIDSSVIFPLVRLPSAARASASRRKAPRVRAHACAHHMAQRPLARAHACTPHGTASPCVRPPPARVRAKRVAHVRQLSLNSHTQIGQQFECSTLSACKGRGCAERGDVGAGAPRHWSYSCFDRGGQLSYDQLRKSTSDTSGAVRGGCILWGWQGFGYGGTANGWLWRRRSWAEQFSGRAERQSRAKQSRAGRRTRAAERPLGASQALATTRGATLALDYADLHMLSAHLFCDGPFSDALSALGPPFFSTLASPD